MASFDDLGYTNKLTSKLSGLGWDNPYGDNNAWTQQNVQQGFSDNGLTPEQHYNTWGKGNGINVDAIGQTALVNGMPPVSGYDFSNPEQVNIGGAGARNSWDTSKPAANSGNYNGLVANNINGPSSNPGSGLVANNINGPSSNPISQVGNGLEMNTINGPPSNPANDTFTPVDATRTVVKDEYGNANGTGNGDYANNINDNDWASTGRIEASSMGSAGPTRPINNGITSDSMGSAGPTRPVNNGITSDSMGSAGPTRPVNNGITSDSIGSAGPTRPINNGITSDSIGSAGPTRPVNNGITADSIGSAGPTRPTNNGITSDSIGNDGRTNGLTADSIGNVYDDRAIPKNAPLEMFGADISDKGSYSNSTSANTSSNNSNSDSFSGLPEAERNKILSAIIPQLINSSSDLSGLADRSTALAGEQARSTGNRLAKESLPDMIQQLSANGTLNSSFGGEDMLSKVLSSITKDAADRSYDAGIQSAAFKQNIPNTLKNIADLGQYSQGSSSGSSNSSGGTVSRSGNPLEPYALTADFIKSLM